MNDYWQDYKVLSIQTWIDEFGEDQLNLNELKEYLKFIEKSAKEYDENRYSEWHHVMPKCIDTEKKYRDEGIRINGADHFRAHISIINAFKGLKYRGILSKPVVMMKTSRMKEITPEEFEEAKRKFSDGQRGELNPACRAEVRKKISEARRNLTEEQRKTISECHADFNGEKNPFYGKHHSEESIRKMKENLPDRFGENNSFYGKHHSEETKQKMRKPKSEEHRRKISEVRRGTVYITDGNINKFIRKEDPLPEGFRYGRTVKRRKKSSE